MTWLRMLTARVRALARRVGFRQDLRDVDEELQAHLALLADDDRRAGLTPAHAAREARLRMGGVDQTREAVRDARGCGPGLARDVTLAWRHVTRRPRVLLLSVLMLGTAMALSIAAAALADSAWLRPYRYRDAGSVYAIEAVDQHTGRALGAIPRAVAAQWRARGDLAVVAYSIDSADVEWPARRSVAVNRVSAGALTALGLRPLLGREFTNADAQAGDAVLLSSWGWQREFRGDPTVVGRRLRVDGALCTIVGVAPDTLVLPRSVQRPMLFLVEPLSAARRTDLNHLDTVSVLVRSRASAAQTKAVLESAASDLVGEIRASGIRVTFEVRPVASASPVSTAAAPVFLAMIAAVFLLALANAWHLVVTDSMTGRDALAVRLALGATRAGVTLDVVLQAVLMCLGAWLAGVAGAAGLLAAFGTDVRLALVLPRDPGIDRALVAAAAAAAAVAGLALGGLPALAVARRTSPDALRTGHPIARPAGRLRRQHWLMASQVTLSGVLLTLASLPGGLFLRLVTSDVGLDPQHVLTAHVSLSGQGPSRVAPGAARLAFDTLRRRLESVAGVERVAFVDIMPYSARPFILEVRTAGATARTAVHRVSPGFFETLRMRLSAGRALVERDMVTPSAVAVVSDQFARQHWRAGAALGQTLTLEGRRVRVVGVVADVRYLRLDEPAVPTVYVPYSDPAFRLFAAFRHFLVRHRPEAAAAVAREVTTIAAAVDASRSVEVQPLVSRTGETRRRPQLLAGMTAILGWVALLLAASGTYAMAAHVAVVRRYDTAVRTVCGATPWQVVGRFLAYGGWPLVVGLGLGLVGGYLAARSLTVFVHRGAELDLLPAVVVAALLAVTAGAALALPAARAASEDPWTVLRTP